VPVQFPSYHRGGFAAALPMVGTPPALPRMPCDGTTGMASATDAPTVSAVGGPRAVLSHDSQVLSLCHSAAREPHCILDRRGGQESILVGGQELSGQGLPDFALSWTLCAAPGLIVPPEVLRRIGWPGQEEVPRSTVRNFIDRFCARLALNADSGWEVVGNPVIGYRLSEGIAGLPEAAVRRFRHVVVDLFGSRALVNGQETVHLEPNACKVAWFAIERAGISFTRAELGQAVWGEGVTVTDAMIEGAFTGLRNKLLLDADHGAELIWNWQEDRGRLRDLERNRWQPASGDHFRFRHIVVDRLTRDAEAGGRPAHLSKLEWGFTGLVMERFGRPVPAAVLIPALWPDAGGDMNESTIRVVATGARRKLGLDADELALDGGPLRGYRLRDAGMRIEDLPRDTVVRLRHVVLDPFESRAAADGQEVKLSPRENQAAQWLLRHAGRPARLDTVAGNLWGDVDRRTRRSARDTLQAVAGKLGLDAAHGLALDLDEECVGLRLADGAQPSALDWRVLETLRLDELGAEPSRTLPALTREALATLRWQAVSCFAHTPLPLEQRLSALSRGRPLMPAGFSLPPLQTAFGPVQLGWLDRIESYAALPFALACASLMRDLHLADAAGLVRLSAPMPRHAPAAERLIRAAFLTRRQPVPAPVPHPVPWYDTLALHHGSHQWQPDASENDWQRLQHFVYEMAAQGRISRVGLNATCRNLGLALPA
jgi:DNA-binding response OmpR family regulator